MNNLENKYSLHGSNFWIVFFIYVSVFVNSIVLFKTPFEFYVGYLIFIVLLPIFMSKYALNRNLISVFAILLISGVINIMIGNNTSALFIKVFTGLVLSYFFYYYVIIEFEKNVELLMEWYMIASYVVSVIGVFQFISFQIGFVPGYNFSWILNKGGFVRGGNFGIRINSVFAEPTYLASTLSAAFFISINNLFRKETFAISKFKSCIIILVYLLSFSGLGQLGVFLTVLLMVANFGFFRYIVIAIPLFLVIFNFLYNNVSEFRGRYDSTVGLFSEGEEFKLGVTHGSSFILYNNYNVALKNFGDNFVFGSGIGSHPVAFEKYSLAKTWKVTGFNSNSADANSMMLRLISETGLFGVGIFIFIVIMGYVRRNPMVDTRHWLICNSILVMILLNLFRQGHYFLNGFPLFVLIYIYNKVSYLEQIDLILSNKQSEEKNETDNLN